MGNRTTAILITAILIAYLAVFGQLALMLLWGDTLESVGFGVGLVLLIAVGVWIAVVNLVFGFRVQRLARRLGGQGGLPRPNRVDAIAVFEARKAELDEQPTDWRRWYRLAYAYDAAGDRRRARETMRQALRLSAGGGGSTATSAGPGSVTRSAG
jgi:hypothetical protein